MSFISPHAEDFEGNPIAFSVVVPTIPCGCITVDTNTNFLTFFKINVKTSKITEKDAGTYDFAVSITDDKFLIT